MLLFIQMSRQLDVNCLFYFFNAVNVNERFNSHIRMQKHRKSYCDAIIGALNTCFASHSYVTIVVCCVLPKQVLVFNSLK